MDDQVPSCSYAPPQNQDQRVPDGRKMTSEFGNLAEGWGVRAIQGTFISYPGGGRSVHMKQLDPLPPGGCPIIKDFKICVKQFMKESGYQGYREVRDFLRYVLGQYDLEVYLGIQEVPDEEFYDASDECGQGENGGNYSPSGIGSSLEDVVDLGSSIGRTGERDDEDKEEEDSMKESVPGQCPEDVSQVELNDAALELGQEEIEGNNASPVMRSEIIHKNPNLGSPPDAYSPGLDGLELDNCPDDLHETNCDPWSSMPTFNDDAVGDDNDKESRETSAVVPSPVQVRNNASTIADNGPEVNSGNKTPLEIELGILKEHNVPLPVAQLQDVPGNEHVEANMSPGCCSTSPNNLYKIIEDFTSDNDALYNDDREDGFIGISAPDRLPENGLMNNATRDRSEGNGRDKSPRFPLPGAESGDVPENVQQDAHLVTRPGSSGDGTFNELLTETVEADPPVVNDNGQKVIQTDSACAHGILHAGASSSSQQSSSQLQQAPFDIPIEAAEIRPQELFNANPGPSRLANNENSTQVPKKKRKKKKPNLHSSENGAMDEFWTLIGLNISLVLKSAYLAMKHLKTRDDQIYAAGQVLFNLTFPEKEIMYGSLSGRKTGKNRNKIKFNAERVEALNHILSWLLAMKKLEKKEKKEITEKITLEAFKEYQQRPKSLGLPEDEYEKFKKDVLTTHASYWRTKLRKEKNISIPSKRHLTSGPLKTKRKRP